MTLTNRSSMRSSRSETVCKGIINGVNLKNWFYFSSDAASFYSFIHSVPIKNTQPCKNVSFFRVKK